MSHRVNCTTKEDINKLITHFSEVQHIEFFNSMEVDFDIVLDINPLDQTPQITFESWDDEDDAAIFEVTKLYDATDGFHVVYKTEDGELDDVLLKHAWTAPVDPMSIL